jgi:hypothetical protein
MTNDLPSLSVFERSASCTPQSRAERFTGKVRQPILSSCGVDARWGRARLPEGMPLPCRVAARGSPARYTGLCAGMAADNLRMRAAPIGGYLKSVCANACCCGVSASWTCGRRDVLGANQNQKRHREEESRWSGKVPHIRYVGDTTSDNVFTTQLSGLVSHIVNTQKRTQDNGGSSHVSPWLSVAALFLGPLPRRTGSSLVPCWSSGVWRGDRATGRRIRPSAVGCRRAGRATRG